MLRKLWAGSKRKTRTQGIQEEQSMIRNKTSLSSCPASNSNTENEKLPTNVSPTLDKQGTQCFSTPKLSWPTEQEKEGESEKMSDEISNQLHHNQGLAKSKDYAGDKNASIQVWDGITSQTESMFMVAAEYKSQTREYERHDLKATAISSLQNSSSLDLGRKPDEHIGACEPSFAGHILSDKRLAEHVPSEANAFCPSLALQSDTDVLRTLLLEAER